MRREGGGAPRGPNYVMFDTFKADDVHDVCNFLIHFLVANSHAVRLFVFVVFRRVIPGLITLRLSR